MQEFSSDEEFCPDDFMKSSHAKSAALKMQYTLEFNDLEYKVNVSDSGRKNQVYEKQILHNVSGRVEPGRMLAIMGPSGAGKSTFLDILAGRLTTEKNFVTLNKEVVNPKTFRKLSGYVMQQDALLPLFTVRETFRYAALLRLGAHLPKHQIEDAVDEMIAMLKLENAADTIIGDDLHRGLSGGEKRRVSIGVDIIHQPAVIFLDEPTSGLDSATALQVIDSLKALCAAGRTIIMTVHQPSMRIYNTFDDVLFLASGRAVYNGRTDQVVNFMKHEGIHVPRYVNVPELFLEEIQKYEKMGRLQEFVDANQVHKDGTLIHRRSVELHANPGEVEISYANQIADETVVLMRRNIENLFRTKELFFARIGLAILMGLVLGSLFYKAEFPTEKASFMVFGVAFFMFTSLEALPIFIMERTVFTRENSRGSYRVCSYVLAASLCAIPFLLIPAILFVSIGYHMVDLESGIFNFFLYVIAQTGVLAVGNAKAMLISTLVNDPMLGTTAGTALFAVFFLFSGFFIPRDDIPVYWIWVHYLSTFTWGFEALAITGFDEDNRTEQAALQFYNLDGISVWRGIGVLYGMVIVLRFLFFFSLKYRHRGTRK